MKHSSITMRRSSTQPCTHGNARCTTRIWHDGDEVVTEVRSHSAVQDVMAGRRRPAADALEGRGLWLINQVVTWWNSAPGRRG